MMSRVDEADRYEFKVFWSDEDEEFVGRCPQFPSLSWLARTQASALRGIRDLVRDVLEDMKKSGEPVPAPALAASFSGRFTVRVPPHVHQALHAEALDAGVSFNRLVAAKLAHGPLPGTGLPSEGPGAKAGAKTSSRSLEGRGKAARSAEPARAGGRTSGLIARSGRATSR